MSKELIRLRDLCMAFDDELVLDHINLYINDSEFLTLLGPSGCGKTTTLRFHHAHKRRCDLRRREDQRCPAP